MKSSIFLDHIMIIALFLLITVAFTYPLVFNLTSSVPGNFDTYWYLWDLWHFKDSFDKGLNPFETNMIYAPFGTHLYMSAAVPLLGIISIPIQNLLGLMAAYNILYILSYILSGYFMYLLASHVLKNREAAFVSGLIYAFSPYHSAHALWHLNLMSTQWIPLLFLAFVRLKDNPNRINTVFLSLALVLVALTEMIYLVICLIVIFFGILWEVKCSKKLPSSEFSHRMFSAFILFFIITSPLLIGMVWHLFFDSYANTTFFEALYWAIALWSADFLAFIIPSVQNPLFSKIVSPLYDSFHIHPVEGTVFAGFSVLFLVFFALRKASKETHYWKNILIFSFLMSLGPLLSFAGYIIPFALPYLFVSILPFSHVLRVPARFDIIFMLAAGLIAGFGVSSINQILSMRNPLFKYAFTAVISIVILIEFMAPINQYVYPPKISFYYEIQKDTSSNYTILDIPYQPDIFDTKTASYMYFQTLHKKPIVGGELSRLPTSMLERFNRTTCLKYLFNLNLTPCYNTSELELYKIRYIVVHKGYLESTEYKELDSFNALFGNATYSDSLISVYRLT